MSQRERSAYNKKDKSRAKLEAQRATVHDVVRKEDRVRKGIAYSLGLPLHMNGTYVDGNSSSKRHSQINWDTDQNRCLVCDVLDLWNKVVDYWFGGKTSVASHATQDQSAVFASLVVEEETKASKPLIEGARAPYRARAARRLILLLASTLG